MFIKLTIFLFLLTSNLISLEIGPDEFDHSIVEEKLSNKVVFNEVVLFNENGEIVDLNKYLNKTPILLNFAYYTCPMLCHLIVSGLIDALSSIPERFQKNIQILTLSIDHRDDKFSTLLFKDKYIKMLKEKTLVDVKWEFLYGNPKTVKHIADMVGFNYVFDSKTNQFSHPSSIVFLSPEGIISRYLYGIKFNPFDVKMSILDASKNKSVSTVDSILLFCYNYDPSEEGYVLQAVNLMKAACIMTVLILFSLIFILKRQELKNG